MRIYCDGACSGNPGPGGYGVVICDDNDNLLNYYNSHEEYTTNNIQELKGLIYCFLIAQQYPKEQITVYTDSAYALNIYTSWIHNWIANGWKKSDNKEIKNLNLIQKGYQIFSSLSNISLVKVKGHKNFLGNEFADALATNNKKKIQEYIKKFENNKKF